ncbi:MAG: tRNA1(Val) (adenine(37)-N6)-methyltransferase [Candidatus Fimisoma sp.]|nr:tRNA1(Val) (adenine(37)-N6)-methyltransferase [Bacillota bacterium]MDY4747354.1 tRNA1(Val) (adenine(37)-N6)-methyltransferase [Candidatus Fimisoma sp.]
MVEGKSDLRKCSSVEIKDWERVDQIGFGSLKLIQNPQEFCYGVDAVILADFAVNFCKKAPVTVADLGCGSGIIPLIISYRTEAAHIYGVEIQKEAWDKACRNAKLNNLEERLTFVNADVKNAEHGWGKDLTGKMDMVTCNPPYFRKGSGITNDSGPKAMARHETTAGLEDFLETAAVLLKRGGDMFMVHRPSRLADICFYARKAGLEPKTMRLVSPRADEAPNILLIHMVKGGGKELKVLPSWAVYDHQGRYTEDILKTYRS